MTNVKDAMLQAFTLHGQGQEEQAIAIYDEILGKISPPDPNALYGYASFLAMHGRYGLAAFLLRTAIGIKSDYAPYWNDLGVCHKRLGLDDNALKCYERALELEPDDAKVLASISGYWLNRDASLKAEAYARKSISLTSSAPLPSARMHLGMALLEQGKFEEAWPHYELRWDTYDKSIDKRPYRAVRWDGSKVKRLAIHGEQGLGDEIMFMALFARAAALADTVVIECAERLIQTFRQAFGVPCYKDHASLIAAEGEPDAYIPMGSLPRLLGLPDGKPFLRRNKLRSVDSRPKVGIAWKGGVVKTNFQDRSLELDQLRPILDVPNVDFVSVQYGNETIDLDANRAGLAHGSKDFDALHHRIASCDLIITVAQTALHQAGAMGVPCWVLTPRNAPWVLCTDPMPWYNSVRLIRQKIAGVWKPVIDKAARDLRALTLAPQFTP